MKTPADTALDYLDGANYGANAQILAAENPEFTFEEYKAALNQLHKEGKIQRLSCKSSNSRFFYTYFSLFYRTVEGYANREPEPEKPNTVLSDEVAQRVMDRLEKDLADTKARQGFATHGSVMFATHHPCSRCASAIVNAGIWCVYTYRPNFTQPHWKTDCEEAMQIFREGEVMVVYLDDEVSHAAS